MWPILQIVLQSFTTISMTVYIFIISLIIRHRSRIKLLENSFFKLAISYFIGDFLYFLEFTTFMRCRKYGVLNSLLPENSTAFLVIPILSNSFHYYIKIVIYIGQIFFACNRLSSAIFMMNYEKYWTTPRIQILQIIQFTLPLIFVIPVCPIVNGILGTTFRSYYKVDAAGQTLRLINDDLSTILISYIDCACCAVVTVACLIMYSITLVYLRIHHKNRQVSEVRLLLSSMITFTILAVNCAVQVMIILADNMGINSVLFFHDLSYPVNDLMYSCQPWAFLMTSSIIRQTMLGLFTGAHSMKATSTINRSTIVNRL